MFGEIAFLSMKYIGFLGGCTRYDTHTQIRNVTHLYELRHMEIFRNSVSYIVILYIFDVFKECRLTKKKDLWADNGHSNNHVTDLHMHENQIKSQQTSFSISSTTMRAVQAENQQQGMGTGID